MPTLLLCCALLVLCGCDGTGTVSPEDARKHIGKTATVRGQVSQVSSTKKGTVFLNMGGRYPNHAFTAVSFRISLSSLEGYSGKTIGVHGKIEEYKGKPQIVLTSVSQISE